MSIQTAAGLDFTFLTEDSADMDLCRLYWAVHPEDNSWLYPVSALGEHFHVPVSRVAGLVAERCQAFFPDEACDVCGNVTDAGRRALDALFEQMRALQFFGKSSTMNRRETLRRLVSELRGESVGAGW